ncbi:hypothetical protein N7E81_13885 [Reichenbachiella carrageenanivorans]|uniref:VLRF1 domain-containing protein n=1 Tax=Reichenbachiella carrageenanivorans TaxID=2979869 RepID=A0ABY6CWZ7_9BACT|nr:hypothetical protein [Reichenbachiella carrageenanivorans]UXX78447.1 hypothetical protein N7E81_13885 [Reichenbachiella carrageenanivorans]
MQQHTVNLFGQPFELLFEQVKACFSNHYYHYQKHVVMLENEQNEVMGYIRLPLHLSVNDQLDVLATDTLVLYLTIESGNAAISVMFGKTNVYHTTFSAYMNRKKQGVSQIKYLNKKGKSRAGSRVRLAATIAFFEDINTTLTKLLGEYEVARIAINCNTTLIPYLHQSKVACPFTKSDARLYKIPLHISQSNFTNIDKAVKKLIAPILFYDVKYASCFGCFHESKE